MSKTESSDGLRHNNVRAICYDGQLENQIPSSLESLPGPLKQKAGKVVNHTRFFKLLPGSSISASISVATVSDMA